MSVGAIIRRSSAAWDSVRGRKWPSFWLRRICTWDGGKAILDDVIVGPGEGEGVEVRLSDISHYQLGVTQFLPICRLHFCSSPAVNATPFSCPSVRGPGHGLSFHWSIPGTVWVSAFSACPSSVLLPRPFICHTPLLEIRESRQRTNTMTSEMAESNCNPPPKNRSFWNGFEMAWLESTGIY